MGVPTAYTESELASFMLARLSVLGTDLGWDPTTPSLIEAISDTLLAYGEGDVALATDMVKLRALASYYAWRAAVEALAADYDFAEHGQDYKKSQRYAAARKALADAERVARPYGIDLDSIATVGTLILPTGDPYAASPYSATQSVE